ncbi:MAG: POTRA domain-containing protein, partial [Candidatus Binatia bacterium]
MRRRLAWWAMAGLLLGGSTRAEVAPETIGAPVGEITFDCPVRIDRGDYLRELPLQAGDTLSSQTIEESVRWLEAKQIFDSVTVETALRAGRADLRFVLVPTPFVVGVRAEGERALDDKTLVRRARIREDEPLSRQKVADAIARIRDLYAEQGYDDAEIRIEHGEVSPGRARVSILVRENEPIRVQAVTFEGLDAGLETEARRVLPFATDSVLAKDSLSLGRTRLLRLVRERGFYQAEVEGTQEVEGKRATLRYRVRLGAPFVLEIAGNRAFSTEELLGLVDLGGRPIITSGTWQLVALRMKERYREEGYAEAEVAVTRSQDEPNRVRFEVDEGVKVEVKATRFSGNRELSDEELLGLVQNRPKARFHLGGPSGVYRADLLAEDLEQIRARYRSLGYLETDVRVARTERSEDRRFVTLEWEITEGVPTTVGAIHVEGAEAMLDSPTGGLDLKPAKPFSPEALDADRRKIISRMSSLGYVDAEVSGGTEPSVIEGDRRIVDVRFHVVPGELVRIGRVLIQQNHATRDSVIRRALPFVRGDPLDPAKLAAGQSEIYRLGFFRSVAIEPVEKTGVVRDVAVRVGERPGGELQYGFGYDTRIGLRNFLQIGHKNIAGTGDQATLRGDVNLAPDDFVPDEYIGTLDGRHPRLLASSYDLRGTFTYQQTKRSRSIDEFSIRSARVAGGFEREFRKGLRGSLLLEYENADIFDV